MSAACAVCGQESPGFEFGQGVLDADVLFGVPMSFWSAGPRPLCQDHFHERLNERNRTVLPFTTEESS